jgi:hypothetical protein
MKVEIVRVSRWPQWPLWAVLLVLVWLSLGGAAVLLGRYLGHPVGLCLFKQLTGIPCPTCGFTRGVLNVLYGRPGQAWLCNPLLYSVLGIFFAATIVRVLFGRGVRIHLGRAERIIAWIVAIVLFFANWAYIIFYVG